MKIQQSKKHIIAFYMLGFLIGILYANLVSKEYVTSTGIFSEYFLSQYTVIEVVVEEYISYILRIRVFPMVILVVAGQTKLRKSAVVLWLLWVGFSSGMLIVAAIVQLGIKGILLCLIGVTPQFLFYIMSYVVILWFFYTYPISKWNSGKTIFVILTMVLGMFMEVYVNPILMKMFVNTI